MLNVSTTFKELIKSYEREFTFVISLNGTVLVDAMISEIDIDEAGFSGNALNIGEFCRNQITIKAGATSNVSWVRGDNIFVQVHLTGANDLVPLGLFYITEIKRENEYALRITGYDVPPWYSQDFDRVSTNVQQNIAYMEARGGMQLTNKNLLTTTTVTIPEGVTMSNMDYMRYVAGLDGYNIRSNRQGGLELYKVIDIQHLVPTTVLTPSNTLVPFASLQDPEDPIYVDQITRSNILDSGLQVNDNITKIGSFTIHGADNYEYVTGTGYGVVNDNPFVTENTNKAVMVDYLGLEYYAATVNYRGDPSLQIGDIVTIPHDDADVPVIIMKQRFHIDGGLSSTIESYTSEEQTDIVPVSPTGKILNMHEVQIEVAKQIAETANDNVENLDESLNQQGVFDRLTNNGQSQGIFIEDGQIYINMSYLKTGRLILGGVNNQSGMLEVHNADDEKTGEMTKDGLTMTNPDGYAEYGGDNFEDGVTYYELTVDTSGDVDVYNYVPTTDTVKNPNKTYYYRLTAAAVDISSGLLKFYREVDTITEAEYDAWYEEHPDEELYPLYQLKQTGYMVFNPTGNTKNVDGAGRIGVDIGTEGGFSFTTLKNGIVDKYPEGGPFDDSMYESYQTIPEISGLWCDEYAAGIGVPGYGVHNPDINYDLLMSQFPIQLYGIIRYPFMESGVYEGEQGTWTADGVEVQKQIEFNRYYQTGNAFPSKPHVVYSVSGVGGYFAANMTSVSTTQMTFWIYCIHKTASNCHPVIRYLAYLSWT